MQGQGREEGLGAGRDGLRHEPERRGVALHPVPEREQLGARQRRVHAQGRGGRAVGAHRARRRRCPRDAERAPASARDRGGDLAVRRSGDAVRFGLQRLAYARQHGSELRHQSLLRVRQSGQHGLQSREPQLDALRRRGGRLRDRPLRQRGAYVDHRTGDPRRLRRLPDGHDQREGAGESRARPRLREPRRAADVPGRAVRLGRGSRVRRVRDRAHDGRGLRALGADRRSARRIQGVRAQPGPARSRRAHAPRFRVPHPRRARPRKPALGGAAIVG